MLRGNSNVGLCRTYDPISSLPACGKQLCHDAARNHQSSLILASDGFYFPYVDTKREEVLECEPQTQIKLYQKTFRMSLEHPP